MEPKLTAKQIKIYDLIISEVYSWLKGNDIYSPTMYVDIEDTVHALELNDKDSDKLINELSGLLDVIKNNK